MLSQKRCRNHASGDGLMAQRMEVYSTYSTNVVARHVRMPTKTLVIAQSGMMWGIGFLKFEEK